MAHMRDTLKGLLEADATLGALLTGGIHTGEISRQATPEAFDAHGEVLPCALVKVEAETPTGPYRMSARQFVLVYLFQQHDTTAIDSALDRIFTLLHGAKPEGAWECRWVGDVRDIEDGALRCQMALSRFQVTRLR
jgi:hypothetical protein